MYVLCNHVITPGRPQSKTQILWRNIDQKSIETVFLIAICRPLFLSIFDLHSSIVDYVFDCRLPSVVMYAFISLSDVLL